MPLTRLDNLISSKTGKYLYVSPDDFNASDALDNRGTSPTRPFLTIQRAFLEVARFSYVPGGDNDRFDQFSIMLSPGTHYIDNRPGLGNAASIPAFNYSNGEWSDTNSLDLGDPNNVLYKFNSTEGGAIIPRGTSLVGMDLRRTQIKPLYVPDPADKDLARTSLFQVTGGCYFWQFTIMDGDLSSNSPLYDATNGIGKVYAQPDGVPSTGVGMAIPNYSHHKITNFIFATKNELGLLYQKVAKAFSLYQPTIDDPGEFSYKIQENRIVGPLSDSILIEKIKVTNLTGVGAGTADITVTTKINHNFFTGQFVAITGINAGNDKLNGVFPVKGFGTTNPAKEFTFNVPYTATGLGLVDLAEYTESTAIKLSKSGTNAQVQAEVDSVESASPYVFNVSIRSTWGICGIWADGSRASGFKSMVIAQYTGVSLQKDDRAFIRYDEFSNTWNQANLQDAFSTTPYHIDGTAYWKDDWRNFHVRASEDAFIQCVSIFAVGFADHFLMESGGDMSITNSNSNFGNTSLHTVGYKPYAFNQDKGGYVTDIVPPKKLVETNQNIKNYYTLNVSLTNDDSNYDRLYYGIDEISDPENRPAASIEGYKLGAKSGERMYVKLDAIGGESGKQIKSALVTPNGVKKWNAALSTISPSGTGVDNLAQDAANLIDANKAFIQAEAFGYILQKYPALQNVSYINPNITNETGRYRDASNLIKSNKQEIIDRAFAEVSNQYLEASWGTNWVVPGDSATNSLNRYKDAYRLIQRNRNIIVETAYKTVNDSPPSPQPSNLLSKCKRDIGYFVDAVSLDIALGGGNKYTREFVKQYFDGSGILLTNGLQGEVTQSNTAFQKARDAIKAAITNTSGVGGLANLTGVVLSSPYGGTWADGSTGTKTVYLDATVTTDGSPGAQGVCTNVKDAIDTLTSTVTTTLTNGNISSLTALSLAPSMGDGEIKCKRDIGYVVDAIANDLYSGGNSNIIDATKAYFDGAGVPINNGLVGETAQSVVAFNMVATMAKKALTNQLYVKDSTVIADPLTGSNTSENSCANVRTTVDNLIAILTTALNTSSISSLPTVNLGPWSAVSENSKCKRDIGYIVEAVASDLRLGGNTNIVDAAEAYYTGATLDYINNEVTQTLDAYNYVRDLAIAAMRNWSFTITSASTTNNSSTVTVSSTKGIIIGMQVTSSNNNIPSGTYVKKIINTTQFQLGGLNSRFDVGTTVNATSTSSSNVLTLTLNAGIWAGSSGVSPITDSSVLPDNSYPECASVANTIDTYFAQISTIINNGPNSVTKTPGTVNTAKLSSRATLFTLLETGGNLPNPHNLETGTPVRLVPFPLDSSVDKSVVRLPKGFDTNTKYYVIAPGRKTFPEDFSAYTQFNGATPSQRSIMLATSEENANAGIYIYSSETEAIDPNIVIQVHQYVQDVKYDLVKFKSYLASGSNETFQTDGPHPFDLPSANTTPQKVFFRGGSQTDITGSILPTKTISFGGVTLEDNLEYYVRLSPSTFDTTKLFVASTTGFALNDIVKVGSEYFKVTGLTPSGQISLTVSRSLTTGINGSYASGDTVTKYTVSNSATATTVNELVDSSETVLALNSLTNISVGDYLKLTNSVDATTEYIKVLETGITDSAYDRLYVTSAAAFNAGETVKVDSEYFLVTAKNTSGANYLTIIGAQINSSSASHNNGTTVTKQTITDTVLTATADEYIDASETIITAKFGTVQGSTYSGFSGFSAGDIVKISNNVNSNYEYVQIISFGSTTNIREAYVRRGQLGTTAIAQPSSSNAVITFTRVTVVNSATTTTLNQVYPFTLSNAVRVDRGQLGSAAVAQPTSGTITATKQTLTASATTTTLTDNYPKLLTSATNTRFTIHTSHIDAINGTNAVQFSNVGTQFYVYSNKRRSPVKFAPEASLSDNNGNKGSWYIQTSADNNEILDRLKLPVYADITGKTRTTDTWFYRQEDERSTSDTVYRLRYVIPKDGNYREPINGFVLKIRTDDTRRLVPQRILLKPVGPAASFASITKNGETLGVSGTSTTYDPYTDPYIKETDSKINFSVQSARTKTIGSNNYLELTVFDVGVVDAALKTEVFTTVKIDAPQGGSGIFTNSLSLKNSTNLVNISGYTTGTAYVHAYFSYNNEYYMILKGVSTEILFSAQTNTTFTQGSVTAVLQEKPDGGRSDRSVYKYTVEGANVYTMTVGDTVTIPVSGGGNAQYTIASVQDVDDLAGTYYIFKSETIRKRIKGQQDGIYYLTCIRGDIRPNPTGSGVGNNFKNFKFSQPVSRIYPISTKNDPLWFQVTDEVVNSDSPPRDTSIVDPPQSYSAADNYVHGYVTVNDAKNSITKEAVIDLVADPGTKFNSFTGDNEIKGKEGLASAGSEARLIPISGDSAYPTEKKLFVELRRPSIARSGNHTFEYLGFGPGNYSTGFPARQQVVLTDKQDYYAQAKREDAGIVLYTGLNSSGDLYIGNKKINAITGEETLLDAPILDEESEEVGITNALVTTFDDPVTFNNTVTFNYNKVIPETLSVVTLNVPITITSDTTNTSGGIIKPPITVITYSAPTSDVRNDPLNNGQGDITLGCNTISFGVWSINTRGAQSYTIRTATDNVSPNIKLGSSNSVGTQQYYSTSQEINAANQKWGFVPPRSGDILFKGAKVGYTGSLGWIYSNDFTSLTTTTASPQVASIVTYTNYAIIKVNFNDTLNNLGINASTQFKIGASAIAILNSTTSWSIPSSSIVIDAASAGGSAINVSSGYPGGSANYVYLSIFPNQSQAFATYTAGASGTLGANWTLQISNNIWKEFGVIGSEVIRTTTTTIGDYRLGINTIARTNDTAYANAFTDSAGEDNIKARANLDVVGNTYISGKSTAFSISGGVATKTESFLNDALLVGGDSATPLSVATLRVATTNSGRVGINVSNADLDRTLTVAGNGRITGDFKFESNIELNGGTLSTSITSSTFNLLNNGTFTGTLQFANSPTTVTAFNSVGTLTIGNTATGLQTINIGNSASTSNVTIGDAATSSLLYIHKNSQNSLIDIGSVADNAAYTSFITIGGAYSNSTSQLRIGNRLTKIDGEVEIGAKNSPGSGIARMYTFAGQLDLFAASGGPTTVNFARSASLLSIAADAGTTTVNNSLLVKASEQVNGNITLNGGLQAGSLTATRGIFSTTPSAHNAGSLINLNLDIYKPVEINKTLDSQGAALWGGSTFLMSGSTTEYFLPLNQSIGISDISVGDLLLIDRSTVAGGSNQALSEIVRVVEILNATNASDPLGYRVRVQRAQESTTLRTDHPDNCPVVKLLKTDNVSYLVTGISTGASGSSVSITTSEFGGSININDILRIDDNELFKVTAVNTAANDIQGLRVNDGGSPAVTVFQVLSTTGNTYVRGTLDVDNTITLNGSTTANDNLLKITNGAASPTTTFQVDSANGNTSLLGNLGVGTGFNKLTVNGTSGTTTINGGDFNIFASDGTTSKLAFVNGSGNLTISGVIATNGTGVNTFSGDVTLNGGDLTVNNNTTKRFKVNNNGTIDLGGIDAYYSATGARKWLYINTVSGDGGVLTANINYFVKPSSNLVLKLPTNATTGDMIRFVDLSGVLTYNVKLILRSPTGVPIQGDSSNTAATIGGVTLTGYDGGELICTTPNAAFGLVYAGPLNADGTSSSIPSNLQGWWLVEI